MEMKKAVVVSETLGKIQKATGFEPFMHIDESALFGVYVTGKYNENKVFKALSKARKVLEIKNMIINEKAIMIAAE